jgi:hypothetical protein
MNCSVIMKLTLYPGTSMSPISFLFFCWVADLPCFQTLWLTIYILTRNHHVLLIILVLLVLLLLQGVCWRRVVSRSRDSYRISRTRSEDDEHDSQYRRCNLHPSSHPGSIALHSISNDAVSSIYRRHFLYLLGIHRPPLYPLLERFLCGLRRLHLPQQRASQSGSSHARPRRLVLGSK